ncbi:hypothetical protein T440DRAFT_541144 [Plenodomus tracheiphilus IPT5]|uniref:Uncharacterized protein n=1 Tax=Plenodomus tracheiphilus IPT5 TaxID=1408161 RepID=A0A6A7ATT3_9PLEO|nr:hypothetical protein T440DRAFT_541144 [Plenodomus tracheiphilus IPT5]
MEQPTYFSSSTELADLGHERFDHDTAEVTSRDHALLSHAPVTLRAGKAPRGLEGQVFAWQIFQHTTEERDDREELKGDLHEGQLHRQNRAAREPMQGFADQMGGGGHGGCGGAKGRAGRPKVEDGYGNALCAGRKPEGDAPPCAKGFAEELDKSMFWDGSIL